MSQLRVAYDVRLLATHNRYTGVSQYSLALLRAMSEYADLRLFSDRKWQMPSGLEAAKLTVLPHVPLWQQTVLPLALRKHRVDVFHSLAYTLPFTTPVPSVVTVHDLGFLIAPETLDPHVLRYLSRAVPWSLRRAAGIVVPSNAVRDDVLNHVKAAKGRLHVVYHGVSTLFSNVRKRASLPYPYLLAVGTQEPRKNLPRLIRALPFLGEQLHLVLAGAEGADSDRVRALCDDLNLAGRVHHLGYVTDDYLAQLYHGAAAFVYPSLFEGFGMPVVEAMAAGTPVVASVAPCLPEIAGDAAMFVDPYNVQSIAEGIRAVLNRPQKWISRGKRHASKYTWERSARMTLRVYEDALSRS